MSLPPESNSAWNGGPVEPDNPERIPEERRCPWCDGTGRLLLRVPAALQPCQKCWGRGLKAEDEP